MKLPACACPSLSIGGTYNALESIAGSRIFPTDIPTTQKHQNTITSTYGLVQKSRDLIRRLGFSADLSLKIMSGLIDVDLAGQFIRKTNNEETMVSLMAVVKCTKLTEIINPGNVQPFNNVAGIGTHYVKSVTYGGELVASLTFKSDTSLSEETLGLRGEVDLPLANFVNGEVVAAFDTLSRNIENFTDLRINYYCSAVTQDEFPTTVNDLISKIKNFPLKMSEIEQGIPIEYELLPVSLIGLKGPLMVRHSVDLEDFIARFDDVRSASKLAKKYSLIASGIPDEDLNSFLNEADKVERAMKTAISSLHREEGDQRLENSIQVYDKALGGQMTYADKFMIKWKSLNRARKRKVYLEIAVLRGRNIKRKDPFKKHSDPYVKLILKSANGTRTKTRTEAKKDTDHPKWEDAVFYYILDPNVEHTLGELLFCFHGNDILRQ